MAIERSRSGGKQRQSERAHKEQQSPPQTSSHSGHPRRLRPFIKELPADSTALSALWPEIESWLMGSLLKRGVDHAVAKDACQEVAIRMMTRRARFDSAEHFYRWLNIVAQRIVWKWHRKGERLTAEDVPEGSSPDVAMAVEPRMTLEATVATFASLNETDRHALATALRMEQRGQTKRERDRVSLQVLRARKRLRDRLEGWLAGLPCWRWFTSVDPAPFAIVSSAALGAAAVTVSVLSGWLLPHPTTRASAVEEISTSNTVGQSRSTIGAATAAVAAEPPVTYGDNTTRDTTDIDPPQPPGPLDQRVMVVPPMGAPGTTEGSTQPRDPNDNSLICWGNVPHVPDTCVVHPLRRGG